jgi:hypothetical protein
VELLERQESQLEGEEKKQREEETRVLAEEVGEELEKGTKEEAESLLP